MKIVVMDAQGGGLGRMLVEQLKKALPDQPVLAVGTNAAATANMLKGGADQAATGENAVRVNARDADLILAPIGMLLCDGMLGEVTAAMALAIGRSPAHKILIPTARCGIHVAGTESHTMAELAAQAAAEAQRIIRQEI
ncbi:MAG: DUF3842 family protein [Clostridia bacterium]|nr:DUF3842 family protein [Clostridia bacterium]